MQARVASFAWKTTLVAKARKKRQSINKGSADSAVVIVICFLLETSGGKR
jgi:hypothetical protein